VAALYAVLWNLKWEDSVYTGFCYVSRGSILGDICTPEESMMYLKKIKGFMAKYYS